MKTKDIKIEFSMIKKEYKILKSLKDQDFWNRQVTLKIMIRDFLHDFRSSEKVSFIDLSKSDFVLLCSIVSSLRPMEPRSFLALISMALDEKDALK